MRKPRGFKPEWKKCPCGHQICKREYISNLGMFYSGTGFDPEEKELINAAFEALAEKELGDDPLGDWHGRNE